MFSWLHCVTYKFMPTVWVTGAWTLKFNEWLSGLHVSSAHQNTQALPVCNELFSVWTMAERWLHLLCVVTRPGHQTCINTPLWSDPESHSLRWPFCNIKVGVSIAVSSSMNNSISDGYIQPRVIIFQIGSHLSLANTQHIVYHAIIAHESMWIQSAFPLIHY